MDSAAPAPCTTPRIDRVRLAAWAVTITLAAIGLLLVVRRISGALSANLDIVRLVVTVIVAAVAIFNCRAFWQRAGAWASTEELVLGWCGSIALWLLCLGCAPPSLHNFVWIIWIPTVVLDHLSRRNFLAPYPAPRVAPLGDPKAPNKIEGGAFSLIVTTDTAEDSDDPSEPVLQQLIRRRDAAGVESIHGTLRADFAAGQRHATLHVGFCPPLAAPPEIELEIADGPDATAKVAQAFPHGARIELRLAEAAEEACTATIEFVATPSPT